VGFGIGARVVDLLLQSLKSFVDASGRKQIFWGRRRISGAQEYGHKECGNQ
jgi:hypothetical protein